MEDFIEVAVIAIPDGGVCRSAEEIEGYAKMAIETGAVWVPSHIHDMPVGQRMGIKCRFDTVANMQAALQAGFDELGVKDCDIVWLHPATHGMIIQTFDA